MNWSESLTRLRTEAAEEAASVLLEKGFKLLPSGRWYGYMCKNSIPVEVSIPEEFPDKLPDIFIPNNIQPPVRAHIERNRKICIAPSTGVLLDTGRPGALINAAFERAEKVLRAETELDEQDVASEFSEYWFEHIDGNNIWSIIDPALGSREIVYAPMSLNGKRLFFAENEHSLRAWIKKVGAISGAVSKGYFTHLSSLPTPPEFNQKLSTNELTELLKANMVPNEYELWKSWDKNRRPAGALLMASKLKDQSYSMFAAGCARLTKSQRKVLQNPYNRKQPPVKRIRSAIEGNPVERRSIKRLDLTHLLNRTSGANGVEDAHVAIIGCGAIGSQIAVAVAALGTCKITLVDNELMSGDNNYRHLLGAGDIGKRKVDSIAKLIENRFPLSSVSAISQTIETVLEDSPEFFGDIDLAVIAIGDETTERRLNQYLADSCCRLNVWVEPLGIGGHCLVVPGLSQKGCYECLYMRGETGTLRNMSSLCAPDQIFQRTVSGCAGTFTPFGYADTLEAASNVARIISKTLTSDTIEFGLHSWVGDTTLFLESGYKLSARGEVIAKERYQYRADIFRSDCKVCSS